MAPNSTLAVFVKRENGLVNVVVQGEMDMANASSLPLAPLIDAADPDHPIHLDLTEVSYMDSTALQRLLRLNGEALQAGVSLVVYVREQSLASRLIRVVGANDILNVVAIPAPLAKI